MTNMVKGTKTEVAYSKLYSLIEKGRLKRGERLSIARAMELTGLKTAPVRDSLKHLVHNGHVSSLGDRRSYIVGFLRDSLEDIIRCSEVRESVESSAVGLSAMYMNGMQIHRLHSMAEKLASFSTSKDPGRMQANADLHDYILANCGNSTLLKIWRTFRLAPITPFNPEFEERFQSFLPEESRGDEAEKILFKIIDTIAVHDREKAETLSRNHLRKVTEALRMVAQEQEN